MYTGAQKSKTALKMCHFFIITRNNLNIDSLIYVALTVIFAWHLATPSGVDVASSKKVFLVGEGIVEICNSQSNIINLFQNQSIEKIMRILR